jgi:hypothetical protein
MEGFALYGLRVEKGQDFGARRARPLIVGRVGRRSGPEVFVCVSLRASAVKSSSIIPSTGLVQSLRQEISLSLGSVRIEREPCIQVTNTLLDYRFYTFTGFPPTVGVIVNVV